MTKYMISGNICRILKKIQSSGERAYLVGGCVRDMVLGRRVHDWDIASSSMWEKTARLFSKSAGHRRKVRHGDSVLQGDKGGGHNFQV